MKIFVRAGLVLAVVVGGCSSVSTQRVSREELTDKVLQVRQTEDFVISGRGDASAWTKANWSDFTCATLMVINMRRASRCFTPGADCTY